MVQVGDRVRLKALPSFVHALPEESHIVFQRCVGRVFTVREVRVIEDHVDYELWVRNGRDRSTIVDSDVIWVDPEDIELVQDDITAGRSAGRRRSRHQE